MNDNKQFIKDLAYRLIYIYKQDNTREELLNIIDALIKEKKINIFYPMTKEDFDNDRYA